MICCFSIRLNPSNPSCIDPFGLYADHSVSVDLESWTYLVGTRVLESIVGIMENEPAGTLVHTFRPMIQEVKRFIIS